MSLEITLDKHEVQTLTAAFAKVLQGCASLPPPVAQKAAIEVLQTLIDEYGGARVYFQSGKARLAVEVVEQIEALLRAGKPGREIAKKLHISHTSVNRVRARLAERPTLAAGLGVAA